MYVLYKPTDFCFKNQLISEGWSKTSIKNHLWKYHYVFTHLIEDSEFRFPNQERIKWHFTKHKTVLSNSKVKGKRVQFATDILNDLVRWNVLIRSRTNKQSFKKDSYTITYATDVQVKFYEEFIEQGWEDWHDPEVKQGPKSWQPYTVSLSKEKPLTGIYKQLADSLRQVKIDAEAARRFAYEAWKSKMPLPTKTYKHVVYRNRVVTKKVYSKWMTLIKAIENGKYAPSQDELKTGRFYSRLTTLPKQLRQFLTINSKPLTEIDISNCQCLIFSMYLKELYNGCALPPDVARFTSECETGQFYQNVKQVVAPNEDLEMSEFKVQFFARIFFSSGTREYQWIKSFRDWYPVVYKHIADYKKDHGYKELPVSLQFQESEVMLHRVCARLFQEGITEFYTVHDALYVTDDIKAHVEEVIRSEFANYGVVPHIKIKIQC